MRVFYNNGPLSGTTLVRLIEMSGHQIAVRPDHCDLYFLCLPAEPEDLIRFGMAVKAGKRSIIFDRDGSMSDTGIKSSVDGVVGSETEFLAVLHRITAGEIAESFIRKDWRGGREQ